MSGKINSKSKGKRGELMWSKVLKEFGFDARRGQQFSGSPESPDVVCENLRLHWEVKFVEKLNVREAIGQAYADSPHDCLPVVAHKTSNQPWLVTLDAYQFMSLVRELYESDRQSFIKRVEEDSKANMQSLWNKKRTH